MVQPFVPVQLPIKLPAVPAAYIHIELHKGPMRLTLTWPACRADECGARLRAALGAWLCRAICDRANQVTLIAA